MYSNCVQLFLFSLQIALNHTSGQNDQTLTTSVQPLSHRPITTALEDEESSAPSEHKSRFLTKETLAAVAVAFFLGLIAGGILLHMFKRCVDIRKRRRSRESPKRK